MKLRFTLGAILGRPPFSQALALASGRPRSYIKAVLYHDVSPGSLPRVREQLALVKEEFDFVDPADFLVPGNSSQAGKSRVQVLLTFDDGFKSHTVLAREVLRPLSIKAVFFVPSIVFELQDRDARRAYIAGSIFRKRTVESLPPDMDLMVPAEVRDLVSAGHVIGGHSRSHPQLSSITNENQLVSEIVESGDVLERQLGVPIEWFAFPFGQVSCISAAAFKHIRRRYRFCCSGVRGIVTSETNPQCILRDPLEPSYPNGYVRFLINDGLGPIYRTEARTLHRIANV